MQIKNPKKASVLAVSLIIMGIILVIALSISIVAVNDRKAASGSNKSNMAFQIADSGAERLLQIIKNSPGKDIGQALNDSGVSGLSCSGNTISSTEGWGVEMQDSLGGPINCPGLIDDIQKIKSTGTASGQAQRAIEVAVGAAGWPAGSYCVAANVGCPAGFAPSGFFKTIATPEAPGSPRQDIGAGGSYITNTVYTNLHYNSFDLVLTFCCK